MSEADHQRRGCRAQLLLRAMLIAALWDAPVPWLHAHGAGAHHEEDIPLKQHLQRYHRCPGWIPLAIPHRDENRLKEECPAPRIDVCEFGWHLHFARFEDWFGEPCDQNGRTSYPRSTPSCEVGTTSATPVRLVGALHYGMSAVFQDLPAEHPLERHCPDGRLFRRAGNYFDSYRDSASISVLICIARC